MLACLICKQNSLYWKLLGAEHETNDIYENPINQGLIWNLFLVYVIARNFAWHALEPCKVKVLGFFDKIFLDFT